MPKRKTGGVMVPWLSARLDSKEGRFLQIGNSFLLSKEVQNLSNGALIVYLAMALEAGGRREFRFPRTAAAKYGIGETSLGRHVKELVAAGFIEVEFSGRFARTPNLYRFSLRWKGIESPQ